LIYFGGHIFLKSKIIKLMWQLVLLLILVLILVYCYRVEPRGYQGSHEKKPKNKNIKLSDAEITHVQSGLKNQHVTRMAVALGDTVLFKGASEVKVTVTDVYPGEINMENWKDIHPDAQSLGEAMNKPIQGTGPTQIFRFTVNA
jgi:hypothetical protein